MNIIIKDFVNENFDKDDVYLIQVFDFHKNNKQIINIEIPVLEFPFDVNTGEWGGELVFRNFMKGLLVGFMKDENDAFLVDVYIGWKDDPNGIPHEFEISMSDTEYTKIEMNQISINDKLYPCYKDVKINKSFKFGLKHNPNFKGNISKIKLM